MTPALTLDRRLAERVGAGAQRRFRPGGIKHLGPWLLFAAMTAFTYLPSLHAGFMFDAPLDLPRATDRSFAEILTSAGASNYYRPLTLLLWKTSFLLLGRNDAVVLHALGLIIHAFNGWLVYQLARRLTDVLTGLIAAALFTWFELGYQVVGFVDSTFHSLATLWVLAAVVLYCDARLASPPASRFRLLLTGVCAALALLSHENAMAILPLVLVMELTLWAGRRSKLSLWPPAIFILEVLAFLTLWLAVPKFPKPWHLDMGSLRMNGLYFLQGLAYPLTGHLGQLPVWKPGEIAEVLAVGLATLLALVAILAARRRYSALAVGMAWFLAGSAPAALTLPWWNYVVDAPRLLYFPSVGIALLWASALTPGLSGVRKWWIERRPSSAPLLGLIGLAAVGLILADGFLFLSIREKTQSQGGSVVTQLAQSAVRPGREAGRVYVNIPSFLTPKTHDFLLGHSGVTMLPNYVALGLSVYSVDRVQPSLVSLGFNEVANTWDDYYGFHGKTVGLDELNRAFRKGGGVYLTRYLPGRLSLDYVGGIEAAASPSPDPLARFGDWADLDSATVTKEGGRWRVDLVWLARRPAPADYTVFVHAGAPQSPPAAQADGYSLGGMFPPNRWQSGDLIYDRRYLTVPESQTQNWQILVGLYDRASPTNRAAAVAGNGSRYRDDAVPIPRAGNQP